MKKYYQGERIYVRKDIIKNHNKQYDLMQGIWGKIKKVEQDKKVLDIIKKMYNYGIVRF